MSKQAEKYDQLLQRLNQLFERQNAFQQDLEQLKEDLAQFQFEEELVPEPPPKEEKVQVVQKKNPTPTKTVVEAPRSIPEIKSESSSPQKVSPFDSSTELEKFLGENLANKIGILITVLGVAIGAKYAIDNQMISPLTRIILGYLMGGGLLVTAFRLKPKYETLSAVILSGAMVILYFITYFGYDLYELFSQSLAFSLMVVFTAFTVFAALKYDRQIIAGLGLVGAYAVPFLLSNQSGNVTFLFGYMTVLNAGILFIAFRKYWKMIFNAAFYLTWLIFFVWWFSGYNEKEHFEVAFIFLTIFFLIFYITFLAYKIKNDEPLEYKNVGMVLLNSFIYFGVGFLLLEYHETGKHFLGAFAVFNGLLHFGICRYVFKKKLADKNLFYLIAGLVFVFLTIAVPIQLDGSWVTLIWIFEAALLFWIGRTKGVGFFEKFAFALLVLGFLSLWEDWTFWTPGFSYSQFAVNNAVPPFFNHHFLTGILFSATLIFMQWVENTNKVEANSENANFNFQPFKYALIPLLILILFNVFRIEILKYFQQIYFASAIGNFSDSVILDKSLLLYRDIWVLNFGMLFLTLLTIFVHQKIKKTVPAQILVGFNIFIIFIFFSAGLFLISEIREIHINNVQGEFYNRGIEYQFIRYISLTFMSILAFVTQRMAKADFAELVHPKTKETIIYFFGLWLLSSELLHWMDVSDLKNAYKTTLSILWGVFALAVIWLGIIQRKQHLRFGAMVLFGVTLLKVFFYDIAHLSTIKKTIVLVSLGVFLLIVSYLYNKFKTALFEEDGGRD